MSAPSTTTAQPEQPGRVPGLDDLLINALDLKAPARAERAAGNVLLPVTSGIRAIGGLLTDATESTNGPVSMDIIQDVGYLLAFLADVQGAMMHTLDCAHYDLLQAASKEGKS